MDAFYAGAEAARYGYNETVPVVVLQYYFAIAVSYAARKYGINRSSKYDDIKRLCPNAVFIHVDTIRIGEPYVDPYERDLNAKLKIERDRDKDKVNLDYYRFESEKVNDIFRKHCSIVEKASVDESFLDLTHEALEIYNKGDYEKAWKSKFAGGEPFVAETKEDILLMIGTQLVDAMRKEVKETLKFTCSGGVSYNKMLAKLASGMNKPNDQTVIVERYMQEAIKSIKIRKLRNFGRRIADRFEGTQYETLGDLQKLNLKEIQEIVNDEYCAKWVYFRCRGYDDELVEEHEESGRTFMSQKSLTESVPSMKELSEIISMIIADLTGRLTTFYRKSGRVPKTLSIGYFDRKARERKSKSGPVNFNVKEERFSEVLKAGINGLLKVIADVLFPCINITVTARNFEKIKKYGADLTSFAASKDDKSKQKQLSFFKKPAVQTSAPFIQENSNTLPFSEQENPLSFNENSSRTVLFPEEDASRSIFQMEQEESALTKSEMIEEEEEEECEKCGKLIPAKDLVDHYDLHLAEELDKELNPHKRKYRQVDGDHVMVNVEGKEHKEKKTQELLAHPKKIVENKNNLFGVSFKNAKKDLVEKEKNPGKKKVVQMKSLDSFFSKK